MRPTAKGTAPSDVRHSRKACKLRVAGLRPQRQVICIGINWLFSMRPLSTMSSAVLCRGGCASESEHDEI